MADLDFSALESLTELGKGKKGKGDKQAASNEDGPFRLLDWDKIEEDPNQPRTHMDEAALQELADSIKQPGKDGKPRGILQPISVRENPDKPGHYLINHGHRRHRAQGIAGLKKQPVPAIIDNDSTRTDQLLENIQREDLDAFDIANSIEALVEEGWKLGDIAKALGKKNAWLSHYRAFAASPEEIKDLYRQGVYTGVTTLSDLARAWKKDPDTVAGLVEKWLKVGEPLTRIQIQQALKPAPPASALNNDGGSTAGGDPSPAGTDLEPTNSGGGVTSNQESDEDGQSGGEENAAPQPTNPQKPTTEGDTDKIIRPCLWVAWKLEGEEYQGRLLMNRRPSKTGMVWVEEKDSGRPFEVVATGVTLEELTESK